MFIEMRGWQRSLIAALRSYATLGSCERISTAEGFAERDVVGYRGTPWDVVGRVRTLGDNPKTSRSK